MKKYIAVVALLCLVLCGCDGAGSSSGTTTSPSGSDSGTSTPSGSFEDDGSSSDGTTPGNMSSGNGSETETIVSASSKVFGWGMGKELNEKNQPVESIRCNEKYADLNAVFIGKDEKVIYLTFDAGYENGNTAKILDTLKNKKVKATFFLVYDYVEKNPELVKRMINEGHIIGNHSYSHKCIPKLSTEAGTEEIMKMHNFMKEQYGFDMKVFRFPAGEYSGQAMSLVKGLGYKSVFWSYAYVDWVTDKQIGEQAALKKLTDNIHNGAIYLLHPVSDDNAAILGDFIDACTQKGYTFSTEF